MYGPERGCIAIVMPLGAHPTNKNEIIVWDLAHDPAELFALDAAAVRERMFTRAADLPEGATRLPIKTIHVNKSPIVIASLRTLTPEMTEKWGVDLTRALGHVDAIRRGPNLVPLWREVFARPQAEQRLDVDEDLYGGVIGNGDRRLLNQLRALPPAALATERISFTDARLEELLFRYRARNFPATLSETEQKRWETHRVAQLHHGAGGTRSLSAFFDRIDTLSESADERGEAILGALYDYAEMIAPPADF
jgi:exodeoxyribonuclease-1